MKRLWVNANPYVKEIAIAALESGAEAVVLPDGHSDTVRQFGRIKTVETSGDLKLRRRRRVHRHQAARPTRTGPPPYPPASLVVLKMLDWTIIPIENSATRRGGNLIVQVENSDQARLMVEILEKGVDGVLLNTTNVNDQETAQIVHGVSEKVGLVEAVVATVRQRRHGRPRLPGHPPAPQMTVGEGMLVGNTASGFFLVHLNRSTTPTSRRVPSVSTRAVHAYAMAPGGKTKIPGRSGRRATRLCSSIGRDAARLPIWAATRSNAGP